MSSTNDSSMAVAPAIAAELAQASPSVSADVLDSATCVPQQEGDAVWRPACPSCEKAARVRSHEFMAECKGCAARAAGRSPHFHRVQKAGVLDRHYRGLLAQYGVTHDQVKAAVAADKAAKP